MKLTEMTDEMLKQEMEIADNAADSLAEGVRIQSQYGRDEIGLKILVDARSWFRERASICKSILSKRTPR